jgi:L-iditol 2-dehydrogenase
LKAIVYRGVDDFRLEDMPRPKIEPKEILVRIRACGICSTDLFKAKYRARPGAVFGHEISGDVAEVGEKVSKFNVGDRVAVLHHAPCGSCHFCLRGQEILCDQYRRTKVEPGGFAEYIRVGPELARQVVVKITDEMTYHEGTMVEPTACAHRAITRSSVMPGDTVLVMGDGTLGVLNAQMAKTLGATQVISSGHHDYRLKLAEKLGIDYSFNSKEVDIGDKVRELTDERGADLTIVAVASTDAIQEAMGMVRLGGKVCVFGDFRDVPQPNLEVEPKLILQDDVTLMGSWGCAPGDYYAAYDLIREGRINVKEMVTHKFSMNKFSKAVETMAGKQCMRVVIEI